jgi:hypothetical protein
MCQSRSTHDWRSLTARPVPSTSHLLRQAPGREERGKLRLTVSASRPRERPYRSWVFVPSQGGADMTKAVGRRPDESSDEQTQQRGPESWALAAVLVIVLLGAIGLLVVAGAA